MSAAALSRAERRAESAGAGLPYQSSSERNTRETETETARGWLTCSILALGGHEKELTGHTKGALRNGLTEEEIREAVSRRVRSRTDSSDDARHGLRRLPQGP